MRPTPLDIFKTSVVALGVPLLALAPAYSLATDSTQLLFIFGALPSFVTSALGLGNNSAAIAWSSIASIPVLLAPIILKWRGYQPVGITYFSVFAYSTLCTALGLLLLAGQHV